MRESWKKLRIEDIITGLYDGPHATPKPSDEGPVFFGIKNLTDDGRLDLSEIRHIAENDFPRWTKRVLPQKDDIVFTYEATLHRYGLIPEGLRCCLGRRMALIRVDQSKADPKFLLYYFRSSEWRQTMEQNLLIGATVNRIPIGDFPKFPLKLPPIQEQRNISRILNALDSKISLNKRINAELEALAKAIYDYWFVQFDFPISAVQAAEMGKPELEGRPYKSSGGEMVWNEDLKREVPKGWEVKSLGNEIEVQRGISYKSSEIKGGGVPMINLNSFKLDGTYKDSGVKWFSGKYAEKNQIEKGDLLIAATDVTRNADIIGKAILVPDYREGGVFSMDIAKVIPSEKLSGSYLMMLFNTKHYHDYIKHFASGTIVLHLNMNGMKWYKAEIPPKNLIERFDAFYLSIAQRITETTKQNQELASLRDWLLPMLMNGQVRVGEALKEYEMEGEEGIAEAELINYKSDQRL